MGKIKFIDLFAGIGGMRIPFSSLGYECVFSSEIDVFSQRTYEANFGDKPWGDITEINIRNIPSHDLLLAGFPCQPFSTAGKHNGFDDPRGQMFFYIAKILEYHRPRFLLLENVPRIISHNHGKTFKVINDTLQGLGYKNFYEVLNAKDFGVPQNRKRVFIVGIQHFKNIFSFPKPLHIKCSVENILENNVPGKYIISKRKWENLKLKKEETNSRGFTYNLYDRNSPSTCTLTASYNKNPKSILIKGEGIPRRLTPRECARLQGFSDDFKIVCSDTQAYKQFGNSVAIPVIREIVKQFQQLTIG